MRGNISVYSASSPRYLVLAKGLCYSSRQNSSVSIPFFHHVSIDAITESLDCAINSSTSFNYADTELLLLLKKVNPSTICFLRVLISKIGQHRLQSNVLLGLFLHQRFVTVTLLSFLFSRRLTAI